MSMSSGKSDLVNFVTSLNTDASENFVFKNFCASSLISTNATGVDIPLRPCEIPAIPANSSNVRKDIIVTLVFFNPVLRII
ncbi:hypothetical protein PBCV1_a685R [Paramecium bursaria Chlorella virus 1]|uniref:Uncharacterized protein n=1 Tax=Paramecium bursaria Chlorella virus 1 TaxID=10506 RepID=O41167_PBCV1|nr:hypothetical protein PBCV1_a685R [Paramecium bursaria Chlorella virus 1]AAC97056.1 hypothetical protein [Paramecium bursaria Chlorella virus 1]